MGGTRGSELCGLNWLARWHPWCIPPRDARNKRDQVYSHPRQLCRTVSLSSNPGASGDAMFHGHGRHVSRWSLHILCTRVSFSGAVSTLEAATPLDHIYSEGDKWPHVPHCLRHTIAPTPFPAHVSTVFADHATLQGEHKIKQNVLERWVGFGQVQTGTRPLDLTATAHDKIMHLQAWPKGRIA